MQEELASSNAALIGTVVLLAIATWYQICMLLFFRSF